MPRPQGNSAQSASRAPGLRQASPHSALCLAAPVLAQGPGPAWLAALFLSRSSRLSLYSDTSNCSGLAASGWKTHTEDTYQGECALNLNPSLLDQQPPEEDPQEPATELSNSSVSWTPNILGPSHMEEAPGRVLQLRGVTLELRSGMPQWPEKTHQNIGFGKTDLPGSYPSYFQWKERPRFFYGKETVSLSGHLGIPVLETLEWEQAELCCLGLSFTHKG